LIGDLVSVITCLAETIVLGFTKNPEPPDSASHKKHNPLIFLTFKDI